MARVGSVLESASIEDEKLRSSVNTHSSNGGDALSSSNDSSCMPVLDSRRNRRIPSFDMDDRRV